MEENVKNFIVIFTSILYEALPFIALGAIFAGVLEEMVPQRYVARFIPRNRTLAIAASGFLGLIFPMCECGIIPVMRRLLRKGVPLSCCVCYMLAGPIINFVVLLSTFVAFSGMEKAVGTYQSAAQLGGWGMMTLRAVVGYLVAVGTALVVERQYQKYGDKLLTALPSRKADGPAEDEAGELRLPFLRRLGNIAETSLHDFVDIMVFLILGALLAATVRQGLTHTDIDELSRSYPVAAIGIMMGLAVLLCLCSEADAFVAASFVSLRPAAKLAFLVLGPMLDLKLYIMYLRVFRPRLIRTIVICVVIQVLMYALLVHVLWENYGPRL